MFTEEGHVFWHSGEHEKTCKIPTMTGLGLFGAFAVEETNARGLRFLEFACKNIHTNLAARRKKRHIDREPRTVIHVKRAKRFDPMR